MAQFVAYGFYLHQKYGVGFFSTLRLFSHTVFEVVLDVVRADVLVVLLLRVPFAVHNSPNLMLFFVSAHQPTQSLGSIINISCFISLNLSFSVFSFLILDFLCLSLAFSPFFLSLDSLPEWERVFCAPFPLFMRPFFSTQFTSHSCLPQEYSSDIFLILLSSSHHRNSTC